MTPVKTLLSALWLLSCSLALCSCTDTTHGGEGKASAPIETAEAMKNQPSSASPTGQTLPPDMAAWTEADKEAQRAAGQAVLAMVQKAKESGDAVCTIPPGHYRFGREKGFSIINWKNLQNLHIVAKGVTFWFDHWKFGIHLQASKNVVLEGLAIDYDPLPYTQGVVVGLHESADLSDNYIDFQIDPGFLSPERIFHDEKLDKTPASVPVVFFDPEGEKIKANQWGKPSRLEPRGDGVWRIYRDMPGVPWPDVKVQTYYSDYGLREGDRIALLHRLSDSAILTSGSERVELRDVTVFSSPGLVFVDTGSYETEGAHIYRRCAILRRPQTKRLFSGNCDGFHSTCERVGPVIEDCVAEYIGDDFINIRGELGVVLQAVTPTQFLLGPRHDFTGQWLLKPGAALTFLKYETGEKIATARIVEAEEETSKEMQTLREDVREKLRTLIWSNKGVFRVELDQPVDLKQADYFFYEDNAGAGFTVRGNRFRDNLARGLRVLAPQGVVENNHFLRAKSQAITITTQINWLEGGICDDIIVRGNTFEDCGARGLVKTAGLTSSGATVLIGIEQRLTEPAMPAILQNNILIENNRIVRSWGATFQIANASNVTIRNNTVVEPCRIGTFPRTPEMPDQLFCGTVVHPSVDRGSIGLENNRYEQTPEGFLGETLFLEE